MVASASFLLARRTISKRSVQSRISSCPTISAASSFHRVTRAPNREPLFTCLCGLDSDFLVNYYSEDRPYPQSFTKPIRHSRRPTTVLPIFKPHLQSITGEINWLTRMFCIEYQTLFSVVLPALARWNVPVPLEEHPIISNSIL